MWLFHVISCLLITVHYTKTQPVLDTSTHNISLTSGYSAVLTCQVRKLGDAKVIWQYKSSDDTTVMLTYGRKRLTSDERFSVDLPYPTDWNLFIRHAKPRDAGTYLCIVTSNPPQTKQVNLFIRVAPTINHDETSKSPLNVKEGQNVTLTCVASAEPPASIIWHFFPFNSNVEDQFPKTVTGEAITIHSISRQQAGIYMCQAFNGIPPVSTKNITLNVEFPPDISTKVSKISQYRGRDTSIDCNIKAYPHNKAVWRKGHVEFSEDDTVWKFVSTEYKQSNTEVVLNLQIYTLEPGDFGLYTCYAENKHGNATTTVLIEEIITTKAPPTTTTTTTPTTTTTTVTTTSTTTLTSVAKNTTLSSLLTTTTRKDVIIDENNSSNNNGGEPPYSVITTPVVKPPDGQGPHGAATCIGMKWTTISFFIISVIVII